MWYKYEYLEAYDSVCETTGEYKTESIRVCFNLNNVSSIEFTEASKKRVEPEWRLSVYSGGKIIFYRTSRTAKKLYEMYNSLLEAIAANALLMEGSECD